MLLIALYLVLTFLPFAGLALWGLIMADRQRRYHLARLRRARAEGLPLSPEAELSIVQHRRRNARGKEQGLLLLDRHLAQSTLRVSSGELLTQVSLAILGLYALAVLVLGMNPLLALPLCLGLPVALAALAVKFGKARYLASFTANLPEALDVFARGLRAGRPVTDSLAIVMETAKGPVQREFARCHDEICMGTSLSDSLSRLNARLPTSEVSFFAVATSLQAETGGNLIETMENLAAQLRERRKLRKKARALTSEARASAVILAALPFAVGLAILALNAQYLAPLWTDPRGQIMALGGLLSIGLGVLMMIRMGKLDV
ncbi:MAG: type II secretion system F family protein [Sulfitobacter sp.]|nr:type II secretion system F family protein [Sulfitobacter sp.]